MFRRPEDIDQAIIELNKVMDAHLEWVVNVLDACINDGDLREDIMGCEAHKHCRFSLWLNLVQPVDDAEKVFITQLRFTHQQMHNEGRKLVNAFIAGDIHPGRSDDFRRTLINFSSVLARYKTRLIALRSHRDNLTGLPLRQLLNDTFERGLIFPQREQPYLLLLDIDYFKRINDTLGHLAGDSILRMLAILLRKAARQHDAIFRYGGEEFIVILYADCDTAASTIADRIGKHIANHVFAIDDKSVRVTLTSGITRILPDDSLENAVNRADKALYEGKRQGRNRAMFINSKHHIALIHAA